MGLLPRALSWYRHAYIHIHIHTARTMVVTTICIKLHTKAMTRSSRARSSLQLPIPYGARGRQYMVYIYSSIHDDNIEYIHCIHTVVYMQRDSTYIHSSIHTCNTHVSHDSAPTVSLEWEHRYSNYHDCKKAIHLIPMAGGGRGYSRCGLYRRWLSSSLYHSHYILNGGSRAWASFSNFQRRVKKHQWIV